MLARFFQRHFDAGTYRAEQQVLVGEVVEDDARAQHVKLQPLVNNRDEFLRQQEIESIFRFRDAKTGNDAALGCAKRPRTEPGILEGIDVASRLALQETRSIFTRNTQQSPVT